MNEILFNSILWIVEFLIGAGLLLVLYKIFGKIGLFILIPIYIIYANIAVLQLASIFGLIAGIGNTYSLSYLATDFISEKYGKKLAKQACYLGIAGMVIFTFYTQIMLLYVPSFEDWARPSLQAIFALMPRIALASIIAYTFSSIIDVTIFHKIKDQTGEKKLWLRNNASTMVASIFDTLIFLTIAFYGVFPNYVLLNMGILGYLFKVLNALIDTPFMYYFNKIKPMNE
jgi:hypothetical protein